MDDETVQRLTKVAVQIFLADWEDTPEAQVVKRDGNSFLLIKPEDAHYATVHINIEEKFEYEIRHYLEVGEEEEGQGNAELEQYARLHLPSEIHYAIQSTPSILSFAVTLVNIVSMRNRLEALFGSLGQEMKAELAKLAERVTQVVLKQHNLTGEIKPGASPAIDGRDVINVIHRIDPASLSKRRLARELGVTPATVRTWLRRNGFETPKELVEDLVQRLEQGMRTPCDDCIDEQLTMQGEGAGRN